MAIKPDYQDMVEKVGKALLDEKLMAETREMMSKEGFLYPSPPPPKTPKIRGLRSSSGYIMEDVKEVFDRLSYHMDRNLRHGLSNEAKITEVLYQFVELAIKRMER